MEGAGGPLGECLGGGREEGDMFRFEEVGGFAEVKGGLVGGVCVPRLREDVRGVGGGFWDEEGGGGWSGRGAGGGSRSGVGGRGWVWARLWTCWQGGEWLGAIAEAF